MTFAQLVQSHAAIGGLVDVLEAELPQEVADDTQHGLVVIHNQNVHVLID